MALSSVSYTASAAQDTFTITFGFLKEAHVYLTIDGVASSAFTLASATSLVLDTPATGGEEIVIYRVTPNTLAGQLVNFAGGVPVTEDNMDKTYTQLLYIIQESLDSVTALTSAAGGDGVLGAPGSSGEMLVSDGSAWNSTAVTAVRTNLDLPGPIPADGTFLVSDGTDYVGESGATARTSLGLGSAAVEDVGTSIGDVVQLEDVSSSAGLPAVDGSQLTGLPTGTSITDLARYNMAGQALVESTSGTWYESSSFKIEINGFADSDGSFPYRDNSNIVHSTVSDDWTVQPGLWLVMIELVFSNSDTGTDRIFDWDLIKTDDTPDTKTNTNAYQQYALATAQGAGDYSTHCISATKILNVTAADDSYQLRAREVIGASPNVALEYGRVTWMRLGDEV